MSYKIDDQPLAYFKAIAVLSDEAEALTGTYSMPKRKGETQRNWGTSVEPYVSAGDITFDGRDLTLHAAVVESTEVALQQRLAQLQAACIACRRLTTPHGSYKVLVKGEIKSDFLKGRKIAHVSIPFFEEEVTFPPLTIRPTSYTDKNTYRLDGYNLAPDFGITVIGINGLTDISKRIEVNTTSPYPFTHFRELREITLRCSMESRHPLPAHIRMGQFHTLCSLPGLRTLTYEGTTLCHGFIKDGFSAKINKFNRINFDLKITTI